MQYTYQDYLEVKEKNSETDLIQFVANAIDSHKRSDEYERTSISGTATERSWSFRSCFIR